MVKVSYKHRTEEHKTQLGQLGNDLTASQLNLYLDINNKLGWNILAEGPIEAMKAQRLQNLGNDNQYSRLRVEVGVGEGKILMGDKNEVSDHKYHAKE